MALHAPATPFTWDDLAQMPDDGYRRELVHGQLLVTPSPAPLHQRAQLRLGMLLANAVPHGLEVLTAPLDIKVADDTVVQPDVLVLRSEDFFPHGPLAATPVLVVEIASPSTAVTDRTLKRAIYEKAGVGSYWLVDPAGPSLTALELEDDVYREIATVRSDEPFAATKPFSVTIAPSALVRRPP